MRLQAFKFLVAALFLVPLNDCIGQDNSNEEELIEFSYTTKNFNKTFPFDQFFSIKLQEIPTNVTSVKIQFFEYDLGNTKFKKGTTVTPAQLTNSTIVYETEEWNRATNSTDKSAEIPVPYQLKPNHKYIIGVVSTTKTRLSTTDKATLTAALKLDREVTGIINEVSQRYLNEPIALPNYSSLNITQAQFNEIANRVVLKTNREYRVYSIDPASQLFDLTTFINSLVNIRQTLHDLSTSGNVMGDANKDKILIEIENFNQLLNKINWGNAAQADVDFSALTTKKDAIFNQFAGGVANLPSSIKAKKANIEAFIGAILGQRDSWLTTITDNTISASTYLLSTIDATYRTDFVKNAKLYVTLDVGAAYVWRIDRVLSYSGANIYLRPVNKNIPLRNYRGLDWFTVRTSFLIGITMNSVEKSNTRKGLIGTSALVLGAGIRPVPFLKINGGCFMYYNYSTNPLISQDKYRTTFSPFVSISIDVDAKALFGGIGEAIFK
jgi:hypothetical protein